jgi:hypothetical protein
VDREKIVARQSEMHSGDIVQVHGQPHDRYLLVRRSGRESPGVSRWVAHAQVESVVIPISEHRDYVVEREPQDRAEDPRDAKLRRIKEAAADANPDGDACTRAIATILTILKEN